MNFCSSLFQNFGRIKFVNLYRSFSDLTKPIKYYGFDYFPRYKNFKDPPYTPAKLFLITRYKPMKGRNPEERNILGRLNIDGEKQLNNHVNIVKNTPEMNAMLWKVKHLIIIKPIWWKGDLPEDCDKGGTHLRSTGELVISPKLEVSKEAQKFTEQYLNGNYKMSHRYVKKYLLAKWETNSQSISPPQILPVSDLLPAKKNSRLKVTVNLNSNKTTLKKNMVKVYKEFERICSSPSGK